MNASLFASTERHFIWHWQYSVAVERGVARSLGEFKCNYIYVQPKPISSHDTAVCAWVLFFFFSLFSPLPSKKKIVPQAEQAETNTIKYFALPAKDI